MARGLGSNKMNWSGVSGLITPGHYDGSKLHRRQAVGLLIFNKVLSQPVLSLFLPGTLPERVFATQHVALRKTTSAVGALKSLAVVWEMVHNPRRKTHLAYPESFSNMLTGNFPIHPNICAQTGRKHLTRFLAYLRLSFRDTVPNRLRLCRYWTVRTVSKPLLSFYFSRLGGTFAQRSFPQSRSESCSRVFKNRWTLQLSKLLQNAQRLGVTSL